MLPMILTINTKDIPENQSFRNLIKSLVSRIFSNEETVESIHLEVTKTTDSMVPFNVEVNLQAEGSKALKTTAASSNYLTAVSQALSRMEQQIERTRA